MRFFTICWLIGLLLLSDLCAQEQESYCSVSVYGSGCLTKPKVLQTQGDKVQNLGFANELLKRNIAWQITAYDPPIATLRFDFFLALLFRSNQIDSSRIRKIEHKERTGIVFGRNREQQSHG